MARLLFRSSLAALAILATAALVAPAAQAQSPAAKARFSDAGVYSGPPDLPLTLSMIVAGGGPAHFKSTTLVGTLAGPSTKAEVAKLTKQFGAAKLQSFLTVFDFVVSDSLRLVTEKKVPLPKAPKPDPKDGKALSAALYTAGVEDGRYNVEIMLDHLVSHPIHVQVMDDIDAKYGSMADANYHIILTQSVLDLKAAYKL
ncbi:MAG: hypothetical protein ABI186_09745 [Candidatus Elarobacter sp.]